MKKEREGVGYHKRIDRFIARITVNKKPMFLFQNKQDAVNARKEANDKYNFHSNHGAKQ